MSVVQICLLPTATEEVSQHLSKKAGDIILCQIFTPKLGAPFRNHSEDYWSWSEFMAAPLLFFLFRFHWNLPKACFTDFCKILGAVSWARLLSRNRQDPKRALLRWTLQSCGKRESCTDLQQLEIQPWILNELFSVHLRSGSHSVAAMCNICARRRDSYCRGATAPSPATGHEWEAVRSPRVSIPASHYWYQWFAALDRAAVR